MTEIPEHLLKRSKERRAAIGGDADAGAEAPAPESASEAVEAAAPAAAPAPAPAAAVAEPAPKAPEPVRPEVEAALRRKKIPIWAMPVLAALPLWAYVYQATLEPAPTGELTPLEAGAAVYSSNPCATCHGGGGGGNAAAPALDTVLETWPDFRDHMMWVRVGSEGWFAASGEQVYGAPAKPHSGNNMPAFPLLSDQELAEVVLYERVQFGGMEESGEEYELLLSIAEGTTTFADAGLGELSAAAGIEEATLAPGG